MKFDFSGYDIDSPIVALATPWGESAIAVVRTSGQGVIAAFDSIFFPKSSGEKKEVELAKSAGYRIYYGILKHPETGKTVDEIILALYKSPRSYTGEDMVEIFCHGSMAGIKEVIALLRFVGFRDAEPGEFTLRAFLNGKMDLTKADAVNEIIKSKSTKAMGMALEKLSGALYEKINRIKELIVQVLAAVEIQLDYAEDEADAEAFTDTEKLSNACSMLEELVATYKIGKLYREGVTVVFAGKTNAGKSSLFNVLNRNDRSIVSPEHGTTRDYIDSCIVLEGIPIKLYDTAGLRKAAGAAEEEGIKRSSEIIKEADIVIYVVDGSVGIKMEDKDNLEQMEKYELVTDGDVSHNKGKVIKVWNKCDILDQPAPKSFLAVSASKDLGIAQLEKAITDAAIEVSGAREMDGRPVMESEREKNLIDRALEAGKSALYGISDGVPLDVIAMDLRDTVDRLGEITGEVTTADILELMFSNFCVGK